jgi:hypothetical protein
MALLLSYLSLFCWLRLMDCCICSRLCFSACSRSRRLKRSCSLLQDAHTCMKQTQAGMDGCTIVCYSMVAPACRNKTQPRSRGQHKLGHLLGCLTRYVFPCVYLDKASCFNHEIVTHSAAASGESSHLKSVSRLVPRLPSLRRALAVMRDASGPPSGCAMLRSCKGRHEVRGTGYRRSTCRFDGVIGTCCGGSVPQAQE